MPVWLSDGNPDLVGCYLRVRDSVEAVIGALDDLAAGHAAGGATFYYEVRNQRFNPARAAWAAAGARPEAYGVELAAALIYLNRSRYNGLFRLNQSGGSTCRRDATSARGLCRPNACGRRPGRWPLPW